MFAWLVELSEFKIQYKPRTTIKAQALADFLVEMVDEHLEAEFPRGTQHVNGASSSKGSGASIILEGDIVVELSVKSEFPISNNQAEYKALITGLLLATNMGASRLTIYSDSQIQMS